MHTSHYSRLEKPTIPLATQKDYHVYITRSIYHYAYARQTQVKWKRETQNKKEDKGKERKEKKAEKENEKGKERKEKSRKARKSKKTGRRGSKEGKEKKM